MDATAIAIEPSRPETTRPPGTRRADAILCGLLVVLQIVLWWGKLSGPVDVRWDSGVYYILGVSIAEGKGYRLLSEPGEIPAIQYPPGLPAIVALLAKVSGDPSVAVTGQWVRIANAILSLGLVLGAYFVARRWLNPGLAFACAAAVALNRWTTFLGELCFAEIPYAVLSLAFLFVCWRDEKRFAWWHIIPQALLGAAVFLTRTVGLALLAAWVLDAALNRRFKLAIARAALAAIPVLAWQGYVISVQHGDSYKNPAYEYQRAPYMFYNVSYGENLTLSDPFAPEKGRMTGEDLLIRIDDTISGLPVLLGEAVSNSRGHWWWLGGERLEPWLERNQLVEWYLWPLAVFGCFVLVGLAVLTVRREWLVLFYVLGSIAIYATTPWPTQLQRYLMPLAPLLVPAAVLGVRAPTQWIGRFRSWVARLGTVIVWTFFAMVFICQINSFVLTALTAPGESRYTGAKGEKRTVRLPYFDQYWRSMAGAIDWIEHDAHPGDITATQASHFMYLHTGLKAIFPPFEANVVEEQRLLDAVPVKYVIVDHLATVGAPWKYALPAIQAYPDRWKCVYDAKDMGISVYRRETSTTK